MSQKNKSAICGYLHIEGVVGPSDSESASRRNDRWWANRGVGKGIDREEVRSAPTAFKTAYDIIVVVVSIRSAT